MAAELPDSERRRLLTAIGGAGATLVAGCLGDDDPEVPTYRIVFIADGEQYEIEVRETDELLYPALDAGVDIPYVCEVGRCGECTAKYDGDATEIVEHEGNEFLAAEQIEDGWVLTCVAYPRTEFELEVAHPDD